MSQVDSIVRPQKTCTIGNWPGAMRGFAGSCHICSVPFISMQHPPGSPYWKALNYLRGSRTGRSEPPDPPATIVNRGWRRYVGTGKDSTAKPTCFAVWIGSARHSVVAIFS